MSPAPAASSPVLVCVDDDPQLLETLEFLLTRHFPTHRVLACVNGRDALQELGACQEQGREVQLVLSDQVMDDLSGIELLTAVPRLYPDAVRILFTGQSGLQSAIEAIRQGIDDYLEKPVTELDLVKTLRNHLDAYRLRGENRRLQELVRAGQARASRIMDHAFRSFNFHLGRLLSHDGDRREVGEAVRRARDNIALLSQLHRVYDRLIAPDPPTPTGLRHLVEQVLSELPPAIQARLDERGVCLEIEYLAGELSVTRAQTVLRVALERLLDNASVAAPEGSVVRLVIEGPLESESGPAPLTDSEGVGRLHCALNPVLLELRREGNVLVGVIDEGRPTAEEVTRLEAALSRTSRQEAGSVIGPGLGLIIAQEYLALVDGCLHAGKDEAGAGTRVSLAIPLRGLCY